MFLSLLFHVSNLHAILCTNVSCSLSSLYYFTFQEFQQHDVQELNRILFGAIESSLLGTSGEQLIANLYHGSSVQQVQ